MIGIAPETAVEIPKTGRPMPLIRLPSFRRTVLHLTALLAAAVLTGPAAAQTGPIQTLLQTHAEQIAKPSRRTIQPVLDDLAASGLPGMPDFLEAWADRGVVQRDGDGLFFLGARDGDVYALRSVEDGAEAGTVGRREATQLRPNAGVRRLIATALVQFQLNDPDPDRRRAALDSISRNPAPELLAPLRASIEGEEDRAIRARKEALDRLITIRFGEDRTTRLAAIFWMADQVSLEARAALNAVLTTDTIVGQPPDDANVARTLQVGTDLTTERALALLAEEGIVPDDVTRADRDAALVAAIEGDSVADIPVADLDTEAARWDAYDYLAQAGTVPLRPPVDAIDRLLAANPIVEIYDEPDAAITSAAADALAQVEARVARAQAADLGLDALSL
ncbi:MAG: urea ABC transporter permease subunit UrtB, partial [Pseudomonadota bacterium]